MFSFENSRDKFFFSFTPPLDRPLGGAELIFQADDISAAFKSMTIDALNGKLSHSPH